VVGKEIQPNPSQVSADWQLEIPSHSVVIALDIFLDDSIIQSSSHPGWNLS
jgi:hypothetical protein